MTDKVVWYNKHRFLAESESLAFLCCGDHFKGFACTDLVCKERVAAVKDMGNRIDLVRSERDFWADTAESDMTAVILTGSDRVKSIVVGTDKTVSAFWVFPYPICKSLFDNFLLCLCRRGFLMVEIFLKRIQRNKVEKLS